ncbi:MAG TPA: ATP-binding protein [Methylomirabilota bacterium]|nr:ATP-binding protein [Methylomirabilota bacterium]
MAMLLLFVVSAGLLALAMFVYRADPRSAIHRWFASFVACFATWAFGIAGRQWGTHLDAWNDLVFASASLLPSTLLGFTYVFPARSTVVPPWTMRANLAVGGIFALLAATTPLIYYNPVITPHGFERQSGSLYPVFAFYMLATWMLALATLVSKWRTAENVARTQLRYLTWAFLLSGLGGLTTNLVLPWITGRSTYTWFGPYFGVVLIALIAHTIIRHRLMNLRLVIHRGLTVTVAAVIVLVPVAALVLLVWPRLAERLDVGEHVVLIGAVVTVGLISPFARDLVATLLDRYVYRTHASYQRTVREASAVLTRVLNMTDVLDVLTTTLRTTIAPEGLAIYSATASRLTRVACARGLETSRFECPDQLATGIAARLARTTDAVAIDHVAAGDANRDIHAQMRTLNWSVVLPLFAESALIGTIALGPKLSGDPYYREDLNLLMTLANQTGIALKNAQRYREVVVAHEYVARIVASIDSGVVAVNAIGQITLFNEAAAHLTRLDAADMHRRFAAALPKPLSEGLNTALHTGEVMRVPEVALIDAAASRPVILTTSPVRDQSGAITGAVAVFSDLTPVKELEHERRKAERLAYFEMLASGVAHEIKNPLVAIKTFAQLLPRRQDDPEFIDEFGRISSREIARIERLLDRLRTLANPSERPHVRVDLRAPLGEAVEVMEPTFADKGVQLVVNVPDEPVHIVADHDGLKQLILNLLMNAYEATPTSGTVVAEIHREPDGARLTVADTGDGIAPELLERIFEPFVTTKPWGTGLGLAISAGMAAMHGGHLRASNADGGGARFTLSLPLAHAAVTVAA